MDYYEDNKETNLRLFKLKFTHVFNDVDDNLFKKIFGLTSIKLVDKLINTTSKEEIQMHIDNVKKRRGLLNTVKIILEFNETIQPYLY